MCFEAMLKWNWRTQEQTDGKSFGKLPWDINTSDISLNLALNHTVFAIKKYTLFGDTLQTKMELLPDLPKRLS